MKLLLKASVDDVTYDHMKMWIDTGNSQTVKGRFYSESDHLLKTVYYRKYIATLGLLRPTETVIIDGLDPTWVTVMRYSNYSYRDIPDSWFSREYLPSFRPE